VLEDGDMISTRYLPRYLLAKAEDNLNHYASVISADAIVSLPRRGISLDAVETSLLKQALVSANGNQTQAANLLGLTRDQFRYRLKKLRRTAAAEQGQEQVAGARQEHR
jgi:DNA-binding protein Fis